MPEFARDFPTRRYPLPRMASDDGGLESIGTAAALGSNIIYRAVRGIDPQVTAMPPLEVQNDLHDPFAELLLKQGQFPQTLRALLSALDNHNGAQNGLPQQQSFLVADGGKILWTQQTKDLNRFFRLAVARARNDDFQILISSGVNVDSAGSFLQVIGWDATNQVYNYYERLQGLWIWAGNSWHALNPLSRGQGPFDSHVNGSLVMKELKIPWTHWHSQSSAISPDALAPGDPFRAEPLFINRQGAQLLQDNIVQPGIDRWTAARLDHDLKKGELPARDYLLQLLTTTTVNLVAADVPSRGVKIGDRVRLPVSFFLNSDALFDRLGIAANVQHIQIDGKVYLDSLQHFQVALRQLDANGNEVFRQPGDTHFAFLVPEVAYEDLAVLSALLDRAIISARLAACLLMVDFPNPIHSPRREKLLQHVPGTARFVNGKCDLEDALVFQLQAAAATAPVDSVEREFIDNWNLGASWQARFAGDIENYFAAVQQRANTQAGFFDYFRLAESRRRVFRNMKLAEFDLTTAVTNIPATDPPRFMQTNGTVKP